jgi:hypothetical protein
MVIHNDEKIKLYINVFRSIMSARSRSRSPSIAPKYPAVLKTMRMKMFSRSPKIFELPDDMLMEIETRLRNYNAEAYKKRVRRSPIAPEN